MSSTEGFPQGMPEHGPGQQFDFEQVFDRTGLAPEDLGQEVQFMSYRGTVASMLADEKCPVGEMIAQAYREGGIDGVQTKFNQLGAMDSNFKVQVSEQTRAVHAGETDRESLFANREVSTDFLG